MSSPSTTKAGFQASDISDLAVTIMETARLLKEGKKDEGEIKLIRLKRNLKKIRKSDPNYDLGIIFGISIDLNFFEGILVELETDPASVYEKMPGIIQATKDLLAPYYAKQGIISWFYMRTEV